MTNNLSIDCIDKTVAKILFCLIVFNLSIASAEPKSPDRYYPYSRRQQASPCAWLERGGIFEIPKYYPHSGPLIQLRHTCTRFQKCSTDWLPYHDPRSITFKLIGTDDMQDYDFQAHFCYSIYDQWHPYCDKDPNKIAFSMRQVGTWLMLDKVNCRCLGVAEVARYGYSKGVMPSDTTFRGDYLEMTCVKPPTCSLDEYCYIETPNSDGYLYGGRVPCKCPKAYHCPLYFIRDKREVQKNDDGRIVGYGVKCKRRNY